MVTTVVVFRNHGSSFQLATADRHDVDRNFISVHYSRNERLGFKVIAKSNRSKDSESLLSLCRYEHNETYQFPKSDESFQSGIFQDVKRLFNLNMSKYPSRESSLITKWGICIYSKTFKMFLKISSLPSRRLFQVF